jgi:1-acyl-sn-glycerol-3-phosphate acyltransferase
VLYQEKFTLAVFMSREESKARVKLSRLPRVVFMGIVAVLMSVVLAPIMILVSLFVDATMFAYKTGRFWCSAVKFSAGVTSSLHGAEKVVPGVSYIITPNHTSNVDILALVTELPTPYRWVVKNELLKIPFFGWGLASTGCVSINRANGKQAAQSLMESGDKLKGGWSLLIYPEGTRSKDGRLQPFKKGAFRMAVETGTPILPVTVNGADKILPKKSLNLRPGHVTVTLGDPIPVEGLTDKDIPELMQRTREAVAANLDLDYDPFVQRSEGSGSSGPGPRSDS